MVAEHRVLNPPCRTSATDGAKAALNGFEYQLGVSVLAALRLMLITKSATRITLEPANNEDLEADLEPATPCRVQANANMAEGYKLVVQVKLRNSGPWSIKDFEALLKHGTTRQPARYHLDDPGTRYLLITNADAKGVARSLLVCGLEEWPPEREEISSQPISNLTPWSRGTDRHVGCPHRAPAGSGG